jgi:hypothetical protein
MKALFSIVSMGFVSFVLPFSMQLVMHQAGSNRDQSEREVTL